MLSELDLPRVDAQARTALVVVDVEQFGLGFLPLFYEVELVIGMAHALSSVGYDLMVAAQDWFAWLAAGEVV